MNKARLLAAALALHSGTAMADTLRDAIAAAYATNPTLMAARARQDGVSETPEEAHAAGRLTASVDVSGGYDRFNYGEGLEASGAASLPIWTGGRVGAAVRAAEGDVAAGREGLREAEASMLEAVVTAYADLLYDQQAVAVAEADIALLDNQVADSRARFRLGNATRTDVARLEAQRAAADATLASARAVLAGDAAQYRAVVGRDPGTLAATGESPALPPTLAEARTLAVAANPLYQQSQRIADAAFARVDAARANGHPSLTFGAGYGQDVDFSRHSDRGFVAVANAGLTLHVPLLTGGLIAAQVRQAGAEHRAAQFDADAAGREAVRATDVAWAAVIGARAQAAADRRGVDAADLALKGVRAEYAFGLRSTLDILVADESLRQAQLALARAQSDTLIGEAALLHATGQLDDTAF